MAQLHVHQSEGDGFVRVPNELVRESSLSADAFFALVYLLSHRSGAFDTTMAKVCRFLRLGFERNGGRRVTARVKRELTEAGYLREAKSQDQRTGRWIYVWHVYDSPNFREASRGSDESDIDTDTALTSTDTASSQVGPSAQGRTPGLTSANTPSMQVGPSARQPTAGERAPIKKTNSQEDQVKEDHPSIPTTSGSPHGDPDSEQARDRLASAATEPDEDEPTEPASAGDGWMDDEIQRKPPPRKPQQQIGLWKAKQADYDNDVIGSDEAFEFLSDMLGGLDGHEISTVDGMLGGGAHLKTIFNTISKQRREQGLG